MPGLRAHRGERCSGRAAVERESRVVPLLGSTSCQARTSNKKRLEPQSTPNTLKRTGKNTIAHRPDPKAPRPFAYFASFAVLYLFLPIGAGARAVKPRQPQPQLYSSHFKGGAELSFQ